MELPTDVLIHCELLGMKGARGRLLQVAAEGYYELNCQFGDRPHACPAGRQHRPDPESA